MTDRPQALLIDDGELTLVLALLQDLDVPFLHLRASKLKPPIPYPERLLITTSRHAVALQLRHARGKRGEPPTWMAFVRGETKSERGLLRQAGFEYLIPEAVHPAALRLLMLRALFQGENTQESTRVIFGDEITFGGALRRQQAVLIDVSPRGCRFLTDQPPSTGSTTVIQIPPQEPGGRVLHLKGTVVRARPAVSEGGRHDEYSVALQFLPINVQQREQLRAILMERLHGPKPFSGYLPEPATPLVQPESDEYANERQPRGVYAQEVDAFCAGASRVLVGRDLSEAGMRVERSDRLKPGERVRLALHGASREEPLIVEAHVARDDGEQGMVLLFDWVETKDQDRLRKLIETLPRVHRLEEDTPTHTAVLSELLPEKKRR